MDGLTQAVDVWRKGDFSEPLVLEVRLESPVVIDANVHTEAACGTLHSSKAAVTNQISTTAKCHVFRYALHDFSYKALGGFIPFQEACACSSHAHPKHSTCMTTCPHTVYPFVCQIALRMGACILLFVQSRLAACVGAGSALGGSWNDHRRCSSH